MENTLVIEVRKKISTCFSFCFLFFFAGVGGGGSFVFSVFFSPHISFHLLFFAYRVLT